MQVRRLQVGLGDEDVGRRDGERDGREVAHRLVAQVLEERCIDGKHADRADQQRVAVGLGLGDELARDRAIRTGLVLDDRRLAEKLLELGADGAPDDVRRAAGNEGDDHPYRLGWKTLRVRRTGNDERRGGRRAAKHSIHYVRSQMRPAV